MDENENEPRERQPRERPVPCRICLRSTWDVDAICERHPEMRRGA